MKLDKDETQEEQNKGGNHEFMIFYDYFRIIKPAENILVETGNFESQKLTKRTQAESISTDGAARHF